MIALNKIEPIQSSLSFSQASDNLLNLQFYVRLWTLWFKVILLFALVWI